MKVLVTGGTGFIGGNLVRLLLKKGFQVRALVRKTSSLKNLQNLEVELAYGDLRNKSSLIPACRGCDQLYHVARDIGTIQKIVYTSTVGTIRYPDDPTKPSDERSFPRERDLHNDYKRSKFEAERIAIRFARDGLPIVIVNPSTPIGPWDMKPTPTGKIIVDFLNGKVPAYVETGLNIIDVEDVAMGHLLAAEKGEIGNRYILGNKNMSLKEIYELIAKLGNRKPPRFKIPYSLALTAAFGSELIGKILNKRPSIEIGAVKMAKKYMYFSPAKAIRDLGLPQSPVEKAFEKAIDWFKQNGYLEN